MRNKWTILAASLVLLTWAEPVLGFGRGFAMRGGAFRAGAFRGASLRGLNFRPTGGLRLGGAGGLRFGGYARGFSTNPFGGVHASGLRFNSYRGLGGASIKHVGGRGIYRGPLGGINVGRGGATRVVGPYGNRYTRIGGTGARIGPYGGVRAGSAYRSSFRTPYGTRTTFGRRSRLGFGPYGGVRIPLGGTALRTRGGAVIGGRRFGFALGHRTAYWSPTYLRTRGIAVRGFRYGCFTPTWYRTHLNVWRAPRWVRGYNLWLPIGWGTLAPFIGWTAAPLYYDYGSTVIINNNNVYMDGTPIATVPQYYQQAEGIADVGRNTTVPDTEAWQPLGVFGLVQDDQTVAQRFFQLAIDSQGVIRGNYYDAVANNTLPVYGSVDQKSQRAAWSIGDQKEIVFETGLANLTKEQTTILVHYGKESTQQMLLVRLKDPDADS